MKKYILLFALALIGSSSFLQDVPFEKDLFKERKDEFKLAVENIEAGDANVYAYNYPLAVTYYLKANAFNPNSGDLNYKIGLCYVQFDKYQMKTYFEKAYQLKPTVSQDILFYLGWCYHLESNWTKAIEYYNMFAGKATAPELQPLKTEAFKKIQECKNGQLLEGKKARVWIDNVGKEINTDYPDYAPVISTDEAIMIFTTRRPDTEEMAPIGGYFEDLYISRRVDGVWTKAVPIGKPVNVKGQHDATIGLSPDGHTLYVYNDDRGNGDIYESIDEDGAWTQPKLMEKTINTDGHEPDASLTFDGKRLYFTSDKPGGFGGHDIYYSDWDDEKQKWGDAVNVGNVLNTPYEERSVFIHPDGETMYFASKGHNTMGGYDLFFSKLVDGKWTAPVNLGPPLNTPDDDVQLVVAGNGRYGYCSSYRQGGYGEKDIYVITFLGPEKPPVLSNEDNLIASIAKPIKEKITEPTLVSEGSNMAILTGIIRDEKTKQPLKAQIVLIDNEANKVIAEFTSDAVSGKYLVSLPGGKNYGIAVRKDGYLFHSENFVIPNESGFRQYNKDADLKKVEVGQTIVLRNIFFDLDKYTLRPESVNELERLIKLLNENPTMKIEISGHTDTRGSAEHNQELSQNRAKAVVDYLIAHGIDASRLTYAGYGETKTLISDEAIAKMTSSGDKEEAHQQNRRTEFKILSM
ncbi:MAG: OmpA family protein [Crocinitomicaceae bacterium]|jgi:outer membrane protein OmpA-like peptidoglycan-associated protein/Tol biopolymer transport system component|nr:OmpA family protein [Crocinitomicaceae bacterium]